MKISDKNFRNLKNSNYLVSEIIGTILLLVITIVFFSILYIAVLSNPIDTSQSTANILGTVEAGTINGGRIILEHQGGESLDIGNKATITIGSTQNSITIGDYLDDSNNDGLWSLGESVYYPFDYNVSYNEADVITVDVGTNSIVLMGTLDIHAESDLGIKITVSNQFPYKYTNIVFTIKVTNYRADMTVSNVTVHFPIPEGMVYVSHTLDKNYNSITGIWDVGNLAVGESTTIDIEVTVIVGSLKPTQLLMLVDGSTSISSTDWNIMRQGLANAIDNASCFPHDGSVELTIVQLGGGLNYWYQNTDWNANWNDFPSEWYADNDRKHSGDYSAQSDYNDEGYFTCNNLNASGASLIIVDFWYRLDDTEDSDFSLYYYNGSNYNFITNLGGGYEDQWLHETFIINDTQYFISNFRISFYSNLGDSENIWIDDVLITKDTTILLDDGFEGTGSQINIPHAELEIGPTIVNNINGDPGYYQTLTNSIRTIEQMGGYTPISCANNLGADLLNASLNNSNNGGPLERQVIILVTDGQPNVICNPGEYQGTYVGYTQGKASAVDARDYLINKLSLNFIADGDQYNSIAVGNDNDIPWLQNSMVWPQPGYFWNQLPPSSPGWVRHVESYQEFADTITELFGFIFQEIPAIATVNSGLIDPDITNNHGMVNIIPK